MATKLYSENSKKHDHDSPCKHTLLFCIPCDEVYCTTCEEVFTSKPCTLQHSNWIWTTTPDFSTGTDTIPYTITTASPDITMSTTTYSKVIGEDSGGMTISNDVHADHITLT